MTHWSDAVAAILFSRTGDLKELASIAGEDWRNLYAFQSLEGCDLRGQDLRNMNLAGCHLEDAVIDENTKIDVEFDPRKENVDVYVKVYVAKFLDQIIRIFGKSLGYTYQAWTYKYLIELFVNFNPIGAESRIPSKIVSAIYQNENLFSLVVNTPESDDVERSILLPGRRFQRLIEFGKFNPDISPFKFAFVYSILFREIDLKHNLIDAIAENFKIEDLFPEREIQLPMKF